MAEQEKKPTDTDTEETPPKKSKKMLFILIGVVVLAVGGGAGFYLAPGGDAAAESPAEGTEAEAASDEPVGLVALDTFLVNLSDREQDRYMKLTLRLTVSPEAEADRITDDELIQARMRDRVLTVLTAKSYSELTNPLGKESLRQEILGQISPLLEPARTQDVLFSEFVVQ